MVIQAYSERSFETSIKLSRYFMPEMITPKDVIEALNKAKIRFVLAGYYGLGGWINSPRATEDVDVIVPTRQVKKAVAALLARFASLEAVDLPVVTRLCDRTTRKVSIDVMKPVNQPVCEALRHTKRVSIDGLEYDVPTLEMAVVLKFAAMISLTREDAKKHIDAHDFIVMARTHPELDLNQAAEIAELIYPGGGGELRELVRKVRAGEKLLL